LNSNQWLFLHTEQRSLADNCLFWASQVQVVTEAMLARAYVNISVMMSSGCPRFAKFNLGHYYRYSALQTLSGNSLRQTVHTHCASVHQATKMVATLLRVARVTAGLAESYASLPPGL